MKLGAFDFLRKETLPFDLRPLVESALKSREAMRASETAPAEANFDLGDSVMVGRSQAMQSVFKIIGRVSRSDAAVMITGESGCGKEVVARAVQRYSLRSSKPFVAINCAAIPESLLESELFGHEKGAFTSADAVYNGITALIDGATSSNTLAVAISDNESGLLEWAPTSASAAEGASNATAVRLDITADLEQVRAALKD